jgi:hypothetical protein
MPTLRHPDAQRHARPSGPEGLAVRADGTVTIAAIDPPHASDAANNALPIPWLRFDNAVVVQHIRLSAFRQ